MIHLQITALQPEHNRSGFCCGVDSLDSYIKRYAKQDEKRRVNRLFIATAQDNSKEIIGYYSLSAGSLQTEELPEKYAHRLPRYPVPSVILGRLAISNSFQGKGVGSTLVADAIKRVITASETIAVYAIIVDAINSGAKTFYKQFGFIELPKAHNKLFLPLQNLKP